MLKKLGVLLIGIILLCSCSVNIDNSDTEESTSETDIQIDVNNDDISVETIKNETDENNVNDFAFYDMDGEFIVSLLSRKDDIEFDDPVVARVLSGFDIIGYNEDNPDDIYIERLYYSRGSNEVVQTGKMIRTAGNSGGNYIVSDEADIVEAYNIDTINEEYCSSEDDMFKTVTLYFNINSDGTVEKKTYPKGTDISSIDELDDANAFISFGVSKVTGKVMNIIMEYRK